MDTASPDGAPPAVFGLTQTQGEPQHPDQSEIGRRELRNDFRLWKFGYVCNAGTI
jgi:hypothetical protein